MFRHALTLCALALVPASLAAQEQQEYCTASAPPQAFRFTVTSPADLMRLPLCGGVKYLAETNRGGLRLEFRPLTAGTSVPFVREGMMGTDVQGGQSFIVDVSQTGIFELRVLGVQGGVPVDVSFTPRVDKSKDKAAKDAEKAAKDSAKAAEKARKEAEKADKKAREEAEKAEKKAREAAEKAAKQQQP
ncbi:MAG TPA: hypothetical protein VFX50_18055 [Gemmatimonadales bacterium]|nr:hypothetical protein [Gemmatimonadales bacterium]